jgi:hypothetical protein
MFNEARNEATNIGRYYPPSSWPPCKESEPMRSPGHPVGPHQLPDLARFAPPAAAPRPPPSLPFAAVAARPGASAAWKLLPLGGRSSIPAPGSGEHALPAGPGGNNWTGVRGNTRQGSWRGRIMRERVGMLHPSNPKKRVRHRLTPTPVPPAPYAGPPTLQCP